MSTPHAALSELEYLAAHTDGSRASDMGRVLREALQEMAQLRAERDSLRAALAQAERELERIRGARKTQRILLVQARETLERLMREMGA